MDNKYSVYRQIRHDRTYKTLGKMTWWRVALGVALLIFVLFLSGTVSQSLAARGHFKAAEKLMISPTWMESYRPEVKAFIEAGVLYQDGDYEAAAESFDRIEGDAAATLRSMSFLRLALQRLDAGDYASASAAAAEVDASLLSEADAQSYQTLLDTLAAEGDVA